MQYPRVSRGRGAFIVWLFNSNMNVLIRALQSPYLAESEQALTLNCALALYSAWGLGVGGYVCVLGSLLLESHKKQDTGFVEARWASGLALDEYCFECFLLQALCGGDVGMGRGAPQTLAL